MALARWKKHREKPLDPEFLVDVLANPPLKRGDPIGSLQWRDFRSGKVLRWTVLRGDRVDRVMLRHPDGRKTKSHGWTWVMDHLRGYMAGRKV
jgi:hypothetical protein